ncbi:MAG: hypothetical protein PF444_08985, partial [Bacteroidales bacterium]|nr:hypothetical protein [Bacteroidales bacterium]
EKHVAPCSLCTFQLVSPAHVSIGLFDEDMTLQYPLVVSDGKIVSGYLPLTFPGQDALSMAYVLVEKPL